MTGNPFLLNGRVTRGVEPLVNRQIARALISSNYWSSTEYNSNNAWNVNFPGLNSNNNNKNNSNVVRAIAALDEKDKVSVLEAFEDCCKHKKGTAQCIYFRLNPELVLILALMIFTRTYFPGVSEVFIVTHPKLREIFAAWFIDRIVQHWIYLRINPLFEERFQSMGDVSYNCRKNYGTIAARQRVFDDMHKYGFSFILYVGRFDVSSCFMSIDVRILWQLLEPFIHEKYKGDDIDTLLYLSKITIFHRPQDNCIRKGNISLWEQLKESKSLFGKDRYTGMPIGNITTQILFNFYMSFFDEWVLNRIRQLGYTKPEEHYTRFVDDFTLHSMPIEHIMLLYREARPWLSWNLHLTLHPEKIYIQQQRHGVKYVGGDIMPHGIYIINRTVGAMVDKAIETDNLCEDLIKNGVTEEKLEELKHLVSSLNSYSGFLKHGKTYNLQNQILTELPYFWKVCYTQKNLSVIKIKNKYQLSKYLYHEQTVQRRITTSFCARPRNSFPDDKFLRRNRGW